MDEKNYKSLYEITGNISDINTLLVPRLEIKKNNQRFVDLQQESIDSEKELRYAWKELQSYAMDADGSYN